MSDFHDTAPAADPKIHLNVGFPFDTLSGRYRVCSRGEYAMNGGHHQLTGVGGRGNTNKSVFSSCMNLQVSDRYASEIIIHDSELTVTTERQQMLAMNMPRLRELDFSDEATSPLRVTNSAKISGNNFFAKQKEHITDRAKNRKQHLVTTPFLDFEGKPIKIIRPEQVIIDSISAFPLDNVEAIYDKNEIGSSGINVEAMKSNGAKSQMIVQLSALCAVGSQYWTLVAHVGDEIKIDAYAPSTRKLGFMKNGLKFKNCPEQYTFRMNNLYYITDCRPELHPKDKTSFYLYDKDDTMRDNPDLQLATIINFRGKGGISGLPFEVFVSQSEGVLFDLTAFHYLVGANYGYEGKGKPQKQLHLFPDISFTNNSLRTKFREEERLRRAVEITAELGLMSSLRMLPSSLLCDAQTLRDDLIKQGYKWEDLLDTRGWYTFAENEANVEQNFLSTMDLLRMRAGLYKPYWM